MIDITKKYQTRDGSAVRLISSAGTVDWPILGVIEGNIEPSFWGANGNLFRHTPSQSDLVLVPEKIELAIWYVPGSGWRCCPSEEQTGGVIHFPHTVAEIEVPR